MLVVWRWYDPDQIEEEYFWMYVGIGMLCV